MTAGTDVATSQGPDGDDEVNQTPSLTAYQLVGSTWMMGVAELATYERGVPAMGRSSGAPSVVVSSFASARFTVAVCGMELAMSDSLDCGVPGTEASTPSFGLPGGMRARSGGSSLGGTQLQGPSREEARN